MRLRRLVQENLQAVVPEYMPPPARPEPPPRKATRRRKWPAVPQQEIEDAEDAGSHAASVALGSDDVAPTRPKHPVLADAWDRVWRRARGVGAGAGGRAEEVTCPAAKAPISSRRPEPA